MNNSELRIVVNAKDNASAVLKKVRGEVDRSSGAMSGGLHRVTAAAAHGAAVLARYGKVAGLAVAAGASAAAKASWDQVAAVEQATVGLRAYEKDADKVNTVLKELIKYARSDLGVLFNRKDLFQSAQMLKLNGVRTEDLTKSVEILSRSVGLGLGNWQDLNAVVGRTVATGRLTGIEFDMLTQYGFKLDKSLRNTNISATNLFKALDKGIPVDAMAGQANSIRGLGIRIQTAFRGIGDAILGVDADTSKFIAGGLGDRLTKAMSALPAVLKRVSSGITEGIKGLGAFVDGFKRADGVIGDGTFVGRMAVAGQEVRKFADAAKEVALRVADYLLPKLEAVWNTLNERVIPVLTRLWHDVIEPLIPVLGTLFVVAVGLVIDIINGLLTVTSELVTAFLDGNPLILTLAGAFSVLAAAMAFNAVFSALSAGFTTLTTTTIPTVMARIGALQALIALPVIMPAIAVGAALAALWSVRDAAFKTHDAIQNAKNAVEGLQQSNSVVRRNMQAILSSSVHSPEAKAHAQKVLNSLDGRETGGPVTAGQAYVVGERRPEVFVPNTSGRIEPKPQVGGGEVKNILSGNFYFSSKESVDAFFTRLDKTQRLARVGMG